MGKRHRAFYLSHFKSRFFILRDDLCERRASSIKAGQETRLSQSLGRTPYHGRAHAHNGTFFALLYGKGGVSMPGKAIKLPDYIEYLSVLDEWGQTPALQER